MINFQNLPAHEAERAAYAQGLPDLAALYARIADLQRALNLATADLDALQRENEQLKAGRL